MSQPKFEIFKSKNNSQYYFHLKAGNGEIILSSSEGYENKQDCENGVASVQENAPDDKRYDRIDKPRNFRFNLKAANGKVIGKSEGYTTEKAREEGVKDVKRDAPVARIDHKD